MPEAAFSQTFSETLSKALSHPPFSHIIPPDEREQFVARAARFSWQLSQTNEKVNLTAITTPNEMAIKHITDSIAALLVGQWPPHARVCDVGTGGGLPGIALALARPDLTVSFVDSVGKKLKAVEEFCDLLGISAAFHHERAEILGQNARFREQFDVVVARALAKMSVAAELCLPLTSVGGWFIAMKGPDAREELAQAKSAITLLGGSVREVLEIDLPEDCGKRVLIAVEKVKKSPAKYPRRPGIPARQPL